jgi:hypothetical protein
VKKFNYLFIGNAFAFGPIEAKSERAARAVVRALFTRGQRLPRGFQIWETN